MGPLLPVAALLAAAAYLFNRGTPRLDKVRDTTSESLSLERGVKESKPREGYPLDGLFRTASVSLAGSFDACAAGRYYWAAGDFIEPENTLVAPNKISALVELGFHKDDIVRAIGISRIRAKLGYGKETPRDEVTDTFFQLLRDGMLENDYFDQFDTVLAVGARAAGYDWISLWAEPNQDTWSGGSWHEVIDLRCVEVPPGHTLEKEIELMKDE